MKSYIVIVVLLGLITLTAIGIFFVWQQNLMEKNLPGEPIGNTEIVNKDDERFNYGLNEASPAGVIPSGTLALSIVPKDLPEGRAHLHLFEVKEGGLITEALTPRLIRNIGSQFVGSSSSQYYAATISDESKKTSDAFQIHYIDLLKQTAEPVQLGKGENERYLDWHDATKKLVYSRQVTGNIHSYDDMVNHNNWEVVILDTVNNTEKVIGKGGYGMWSPDGMKLLYASSDGLHLYDVTNESDRRVLSANQIDGKALTGYTMFDISPDGSHIIWTTPYLSLLTVFRIENWDDFSITEVGRMQNGKTQYYWPTFSPDGKFYAVQAIERTSSQDVGTNPRIEIRPVYGRDVVMSFDLSGFDFNKAFIDDWIK